MLRRQLLVAAQIDGRDGVLGTVAASPARSGQDAERPGQKMAGTADASLRNELADMAAGNRFAPQSHFGIDFDLESHLPRELREHVHVAFRPVSKMEVITFVDFLGAQSSGKDVVREAPRSHQGKVAGERQQEARVEPGFRQKPYLFWSRGNQLELGVRPQ